MEKREMYHVHVYFDDQTECLAQGIYTEAQTQPLITLLGRFHPKPIGPHPSRQFQMKTMGRDLECLLEWVDKRREGLSVLIHPEIENDYLAHTDLAQWLGEPCVLNLSGLSGGPS